MCLRASCMRRRRKRDDKRGANGEKRCQDRRNIQWCKTHIVLPWGRGFLPFDDFHLSHLSPSQRAIDIRNAKWNDAHTHIYIGVPRLSKCYSNYHPVTTDGAFFCHTRLSRSTPFQIERTHILVNHPPPPLPSIKKQRKDHELFHELAHMLVQECFFAHVHATGFRRE